MTMPYSLFAVICTEFSRAHSALSLLKSLGPAPGLFQ